MTRRGFLHVLGLGGFVPTLGTGRSHQPESVFQFIARVKDAAPGDIDRVELWFSKPDDGGAVVIDGDKDVALMRWLHGKKGHELVGVITDD